jgi:hypothetical protein
LPGKMSGFRIGEPSGWNGMWMDTPNHASRRVRR